MAISQELQIEALAVTVRGHIVREPPSCFQDIVFDVRIEGNLSDDQVAALAREAGRHCFVENTLAKAIPLETQVRLNDRKLLTLRRCPAENSAGFKGAESG